MSFIITILPLFVILFIVAYVITKPDRNKSNGKSGYRIPLAVSPVIKTSENSSSKNSSKENKQNEDFYAGAEFINKYCTSLDDFIINDAINFYDLRKLADLNGIGLQISRGWYPLTIELIRELDRHGWDKHVSCIKEKYASLKFYTDDKYDDIIEKYERKSEHICESCGERGEIRYNSSWEYVACREHYLKRRGNITLEESGFNYDGEFYSWDEITDARFDSRYNKEHAVVVFELDKTIRNSVGLPDNKLRIYDDAIGFGNLLKNIPERYKNLDYNYIKLHYQNTEYCEICGYKAVCFSRCECCEYEIWANYRVKNKEDENKQQYIYYGQLSWAADAGEHYESESSNYSKNPDHKLLFTAEELEDFMKGEEN